MNMLDEQLARNARIVLLVRIVVFGFLGVLLILALIDFRKKHNAEMTADAWRDARRHALFELRKDLLQRQLDEYIHGQPVKTTEEPHQRNRAELRVVTGLEVYTWRGIVRDYVVDVYLGPGKFPSVEAVVGPGGKTD